MAPADGGIQAPGRFWLQLMLMVDAVLWGWQAGSVHRFNTNEVYATHLTGGLVWRFTAFQYDEAVALAVVGAREAAGGVDRAWKYSWRWWYAGTVLFAQGRDESSSATLGSVRTGAGDSVCCGDP